MSEDDCTCCGKRLKESNKVWLEMDRTTGTYHKPGTVPAEKSQGEFPFGKTCAKKAVSK